MAPRQLPKFRNWIACVVPTFKAGAQSGLGGEPTETTLAYSWGTEAGGVITLPVYDHCTFATGPDGDFETLAERLTPVKATGSAGGAPNRYQPSRQRNTPGAGRRGRSRSVGSGRVVPAGHIGHRRCELAGRHHF